MCVCMCAYVVCAYVCVCVHTLGVCMYVCVCHVCAYTRVCWLPSNQSVNACIRGELSIIINCLMCTVCMCTCIHMCEQYICTCMHTIKYVYVGV